MLSSAGKARRLGDTVVTRALPCCRGPSRSQHDGEVDQGEKMNDMGSHRVPCALVTKVHSEDNPVQDPKAQRNVHPCPPSIILGRNLLH